MVCRMCARKIGKNCPYMDACGDACYQEMLDRQRVYTQLFVSGPEARKHWATHTRHLVTKEARAALCNGRGKWRAVNGYPVLEGVHDHEGYILKFYKDVYGNTVAEFIHRIEDYAVAEYSL